MVTRTHHMGRALHARGFAKRLICVLAVSALAFWVLAFPRVAHAIDSDGSAFRTGFESGHTILESSEALPRIASGDALQYWDQQTVNESDGEAEGADTATGDDGGNQNADDGGSASTVEPTSEVVTAYYHDAWYEASQSDGEDSKDSSQQAEEDNASQEAAGGSGEDEDADDQGQTDELDAKLNNLGSNNLINLQQTPDNSFMYDTSIYDLVNGTEQDQRTTVQVKGEVVGDPVRAEQNPGKYWITLDSAEEDKEASISVLVDEAVLKQIDMYGGYNKTGTILRIKGLFFISCTSHEGIMDIHADSVTVLSNGSVSEDELDLQKFIPGAGLVFFGLVLTALYGFLAERQR